MSASCALIIIGSKAGGAPIIAVEAASRVTELRGIQAGNERDNQDEEQAIELGHEFIFLKLVTFKL